MPHNPNLQQLNATQDERLKRYVSYLIRISQPPNPQGLRLAANRILQASRDTSKGCFTNWATRWITRTRLVSYDQGEGSSC
jgi:hypothetical protein